MSTVWECTGGCAKQYKRVLDIYLMTVISSSYVIIMDSAVNAPGHRNNVFDGLNSTAKMFLKEQIELIGKLISNDKLSIGIIPSASNMSPLDLRTNV